MQVYPCVINKYNIYGCHGVDPIAWWDSDPGDIEVLKSVATAVADAMGKEGVAYVPKRMVDIYSASGTFADW